VRARWKQRPERKRRRRDLVAEAEALVVLVTFYNVNIELLHTSPSFKHLKPSKIYPGPLSVWSGP